MSAPGKARRGLPYVDPATHTPQFSWKKAGKSSCEVFCEGVPLPEIARRYETPTYVYSQRAITDAFQEIDRGLGRVPHLLCFAVKGDGNLSILKLLGDLGSGFDIVSGGELEHLGHISIPGSRIVFSGVGKSREAIRDALRYHGKQSGDPGILPFNVESATELEILIEESSRRVRGKPPGVAIRATPDVKAGGHPHIAT